MKSTGNVSALSTAIVPDNPTALVGKRIALKCPVPINRRYGQNLPRWTIEYATSHGTCEINGVGVATTSTCQRPQYSVQLNDENLNGFQRVSTFTIPSTNLSDAGTYTCTFYSQYNQQQTTSTVLSVLGKA